ncbi:MAG: hypothetical protein JRI23_09860 [Deltaproteobacteria bacterium]|jgi:hypothetical protein|nr:hypothetical protein [Deltaproteobacteria bacterium]MBW2531973.1 hypothetical protein [Deltaproteobacteria bacterium]
MPARPLHGRRWLRAALVAAIAAAAPLAAADYVDIERPATMVVGPVSGHAVSARLGPHRLGRCSSPLPAQPRESWRYDLPGPLDSPPLVDAEGAVLAVTGNRRAVRVAPDGAPTWRVSIGRSTPALAPVLTSDGALAVVCADGRVRRVSSSGGLRVGGPLRIQTRKASAVPLALPDGGLVIAGERQLVQLDARDQPVARAELPGLPVGGVLRYGRGFLVTLEDGAVIAWQPPAPPRVVAELPGGPDDGAALIGPHLLAAVVDRSSVLTMDLRSGQTRLLAAGSGVTRQFDGPVVLDPAGRVVVASVVGELVVFDRRGTAVRRLALENEALIFTGDAGAPLPSLFRKVELEPSPPLIVDGAGRIAFVRASGRVGTVDPSAPTQAVRVVTASFCRQPLAVLPAGRGRMLVACQSGSLGMFTDG